MRTFLFLTIASFLFSCNQSNQNSDIVVDSLNDDQVETIEKAKSIFYNMYLPSEMYKVFDKVGADYDPSILNPIEQVNLYTTNAKAAMNLGVFGVDMSYNKMFKQNQKTLLYLTVIHKLSLQLGIPDEKFAYVLKRVHQSMNNKDSLSYYASDIYINVNTYLTDNDRQSIATMVLAGGWIEALYIASDIVTQDVDNREIFERMLMQKYSLKHLITLLKNHQTDPNVRELLVQFVALNGMYDKVNIKYKANCLNIDSINEAVSSRKLDIDTNKEKMDSIVRKIKEIRMGIVN